MTIAATAGRSLDATQAATWLDREMTRPKKRIAFVVSHPIQYVVPLYQRLARRDDMTIKVFYTWHAGDTPVFDRGFNQPVSWDIPLTDGYEFERVPNTSTDPGTHQFFGIRNPSLIERITAWRAELVHVSGWAWLSHLEALYALHRRGVPTLFRGDSHLLDSSPSGLRWWFKQTFLRRVFAWPAGFMVTGSANRAYYQHFGVEQARLFTCPHSIDVRRFIGADDSYEQQAVEWRRQLGLDGQRRIALFAGKFESKKRPLELMSAVQMRQDNDVVLILVGGGDLEPEIRKMAAAYPERFRVLPFQNQSRMPIVYRLGDFFVLPSAFGESWGLAVNEALACGRPVLVSDRVGCAADLVDDSCGRIFSWTETGSLERMLDEMSSLNLAAMGAEVAKRARNYDIAATEAALVRCLTQVCSQWHR